MWDSVISILSAETFKSLVGTFLGALLGIPAGIALNTTWKHRTDRERIRLAALRQAVDQNMYLLGQIEDWISKGGAPFFNVDLTVLESTASMKYEVLDDIPLCRQIDHLRFELSTWLEK